MPVLAQPVGQAQVVRMQMRGQHPQHWKTHQGGVKDLQPLRAGLGIVQAAVDDAPAVNPIQMVADQPQVDMVQSKRKRHSQPVNAGGNREMRTGGWQCIPERVMQFFFMQIHTKLFCLIIDVYVNVKRLSLSSWRPNSLSAIWPENLT